MFNPKRIIFEKGTLDTDVGKKYTINLEIIKM